VNVAGWCRLKFFVQLAIVVAVSFCPFGVQDAPAQVTVYYFHSTARCTDCLEIERLSGEVLQQSFPQELTGGRLLWRPVNVDLPEQAHFIFDYDLAANELVVVHDDQDEEVGWNKLPEIWEEIQQPEKFRSKLVRLVQQALLRAEDIKGGSGE
jgi:hypothetical protein